MTSDGPPQPDGDLAELSGLMEGLPEGKVALIARIVREIADAESGGEQRALETMRRLERLLGLSQPQLDGERDP